MNYLNQLLSELDCTSRTKSIIAPSWLSKLLIGESQCLFQYYVHTHYKVPSNGNFAWYQIRHQSFLRERKQQWEAKGYRVFLEKQNAISFSTKSGPQFLGNPDLYISELNHIEELKTGKPKDSDVAQLMLYMAAFAHVYRLPQMPSGEVRYLNDSYTRVSPQEITQQFRDEVTQLITLLGSNEVPEPVPSQSDCRFCKLNQHCPVSAARDEAA